MTEKYYTCTLLSDVVVNASLATEGNMSSLDYLPGSSFLGIVANPLYKEFENEPSRLLPLLHEGKVRFGDACISYQGQAGLPMPFQFFTDKEKKDLEKDPVYLAHYLDEKKIQDEKGKKIQPQQVRAGYLWIADDQLKYLSAIPKKFSLKSAHDRETRTAKDTQMFGMEALPRGMQLAFSIQYDREEDIPWIEKHLLGEKRLGKSKSAEFGQVNIQVCQKPIQSIPVFNLEGVVLVYAASHLCFFDETGSPTYQPTAQDLGFEEDAVIIWEKSQIRSFNFTTWNTKRQSSNAVRHCIARGSVFYVEGKMPEKTSAMVGDWQAEGLGKVLYNPIFLKGNPQEQGSAFSGKFKKLDWSLLASAGPEPSSSKPHATTPLLAWLQKKQDEKNRALNLAHEVQRTIYQGNESLKKLDNVTSSQWGQIRQLAQAAPSKEQLALNLFNNPKKKGSETDGQHKARKGFLMHGVAYDKIWSKKNEAPIKVLKAIFELEMNDSSEDQSRVVNFGKSKEFVALFAAEMAHRYIRKKNRKKND